MKKTIMRKIMTGAISTCIIGTFLVTSSFGAANNVQPGSTGADVVSVQERLSDLGYLAGDIDGSFGPQTAEALSAFQKAQGLEANGIMSDETYTALFSNSEMFAFDINEEKNLNTSYMVRMFVNIDEFTPKDGAFEVVDKDGNTVFKTELTDETKVATVKMSEEDKKANGWKEGTEIDVFVPQDALAEGSVVRMAFNTGDSTVSEQNTISTMKDRVLSVQAEKVDDMRINNTVTVKYEAPENTAKAEFNVSDEKIISVENPENGEAEKSVSMKLLKDGQATLTGIFYDSEGNTLKEETVLLNVYPKKNASKAVTENTTANENKEKENPNNGMGAGAGEKSVAIPEFKVVDYADTRYCAEITGVNVRTAPSTNSSVIGVCQFGDKINITGYVTENGVENGWVRVSYNGQDAYVYGGWFTQTYPQVTETSPKPICPQPDTQPTETERATEKVPTDVQPEEPTEPEKSVEPQETTPVDTQPTEPERPTEEVSTDVQPVEPTEPEKSVEPQEATEQGTSEAENHEHQFSLIETVEATCETDGYSKAKCSFCGKEITKLIHTTGHNWIPVNETIEHPVESHEVEHPAETHVETVHHEAVSEDVWVVDKEAYDEQVKTGTKTVVDKEAWTETVVDKEGWTETIVDKEAWTETVVDKEAYDEQVEITKTVYVVELTCQEDDCYEVFTGKADNEWAAMTEAGKAHVEHIETNFDTHSDWPGYWEGGYTEEVGTGEYTTVHHDAETHTVDHPAETHTVDHPAETHTVDHPEETHEEDVYEIIHHDEEGHYETKVVKDAYDEEITVVDKAAWTETIVDKEAYTEEISVEKCALCDETKN